MDLYAYNADGKCMRIFVSAKPCPYQSVPTKVAILLSALQMNMLSVKQALDSLKSL